MLATSEDSLSLPSTTHPFSVLPPCVELLGIESYRHFSVDSFQLPPLHYLRHLIIGNESIHCADSFCVEGLIELKELRIGDNNCRKQLQTMAVCRICNCSQLQSISIGRLSFSSFTHFEMHNLPSLQSIAIDEKCFYWAQVFSLVSRRNHLYSWDLPQLQTIQLGRVAFSYCQSIVFESWLVFHVITQIYLPFSRLNWVIGLCMAMVVVIARWWGKKPVSMMYMKTHLPWRVIPVPYLIPRPPITDYLLWRGFQPNLF